MSPGERAAGPVPGAPRATASRIPRPPTHHHPRAGFGPATMGPEAPWLSGDPWSPRAQPRSCFLCLHSPLPSDARVPEPSWPSATLLASESPRVSNLEPGLLSLTGRGAFPSSVGHRALRLLSLCLTDRVRKFSLSLSCSSRLYVYNVMLVGNHKEAERNAGAQPSWWWELLSSVSFRGNVFVSLNFLHLLLLV